MTDRFQTRSSEEGRIAQDMAHRVLTGVGFRVEQTNWRIPDVGLTVNIVAVDSQQGRWFFDVSGAFTSGRPGLMRTDTLWKTLGRASVLRKLGHERLILLTTNLPDADSVGARALAAAARTFFDAVEMTTAAGKLRLRRYAEGGANIRPLPGLRDAQDIYEASSTQPRFGANLMVPVAETGDAITVAFGNEVVGMRYRMKVYIPSKSRSGVQLAVAVRKSVADKIKMILGELAGGCTAMEGNGSWIDPFAGVVDERVSVIEAYSTGSFPRQVISEIKDLILLDLDQEPAALILNENMYQFARDDAITQD